MGGHENLYRGYERKTPGHEDNLTRAFLIVLRGVPLAHAVWLRLVDEGHRSNEGDGVPSFDSLRDPTVLTQVSRLPDAVGRIVSLVQTDEDYFADDVTASDRRQVLDGVVSYAPDLAIVIENKPYHGDIWQGQLNVNVTDLGADEETAVDPRPACVKWRSVIAAWARLLEAGHLGVAERVFVEDFLEYVEEFFPQLQPYSTIGQCGRSEPRLQRRCRNILEAIAPGDVKWATSWGWYIDVPEHAAAIRLALIPRGAGDDQRLDVELALGDTVGQARTLYRDFGEGVLDKLANEGWTLHPNLHLSFMQQNVQYPTCKRDPRSYWAFWTEHEGSWVRRVHRDEWPELLRFLIAHDLMVGAEEREFHRNFTETKRMSLNVCPGLVIRKTTTLDDAVEADQRGQLQGLIEATMRWVADLFHIRLPVSIRVG